MTTRKQWTQEEFVTRLQSAGLDPAQHDVPELHAAWILLDSHMQRLRVPPADGTVAHNDHQADRHCGVQPLGNFNPNDVMRNTKTGDA